MKTKNLIKLLNEADPSGELECCVFNEDIYFVEVINSYWDGCLQVLKRDELRKHEYNIIGAEYRSLGDKVCIRPMSIEDYIYDCENFEGDLNITYDSEYSKRKYKDFVEKTRLKAKKLYKEIDEEK